MIRPTTTPTPTSASSPYATGWSRVPCLVESVSHAAHCHGWSAAIQMSRPRALEPLRRVPRRSGTGGRAQPAALTLPSTGPAGAARSRRRVGRHSPHDHDDRHPHRSDALLDARRELLRHELSLRSRVRVHPPDTGPTTALTAAPSTASPRPSRRRRRPPRTGRRPRPAGRRPHRAGRPGGRDVRPAVDAVRGVSAAACARAASDLTTLVTRLDRARRALVRQSRLPEEVFGGLSGRRLPAPRRPVRGHGRRRGVRRRAAGRRRWPPSAASSPRPRRSATGRRGRHRSAAGSCGAGRTSVEHRAQDRWRTAVASYEGRPRPRHHRSAGPPRAARATTGRHRLVASPPVAARRRPAAAAAAARASGRCWSPSLVTPPPSSRRSWWCRRPRPPTAGRRRSSMSTVSRSRSRSAGGGPGAAACVVATRPGPSPARLELRTGPPPAYDALVVEDEDAFELSGHPVDYRRFGHRADGVELVSEEWTWRVDGAAGADRHRSPRRLPLGVRPVRGRRRDRRPGGCAMASRAVRHDLARRPAPLALGHGVRIGALVVGPEVAQPQRR